MSVNSDQLMICCGQPLKLHQRDVSCNSNRFKNAFFRPLYRPATAIDDEWQHEVANHYRDVQRIKRIRPGNRRKSRRSEHISYQNVPESRSAPVERDQLTIPQMVFPR